jgi:hypothetical protein
MYTHTQGYTKKCRPLGPEMLALGRHAQLGAAPYMVTIVTIDIWFIHHPVSNYRYISHKPELVEL